MCVSATAQCVNDSDCGPDRRCDDGICFAKEREVRPVPDGGIPDPDEDMGGCGGCIEMATGACLPGDLQAACGGGGADCIACGADEICAEGSCETPPTCDASNCDGCCNGDVCEPGSAATACGSGGAACQQCDDGATCEGNVCVAACGPDTCTGCCADGTCVPGDDDDMCGGAGAACSDCGDDETCTGGTCVSLSCSQTCDGCCDGSTCLSGGLDNACGAFGDACVSCGTGLSCSLGQCVVDPNSRWDVQVVSATVPDRDVNNETWDSFGGLPDPYVRLVAADGGQTWDEETSFQSDTLTPLWVETILLDVPARALQDMLTIYVRDSDTFADNTMGACFTSLVQSDFNGQTFDVTCPESNEYVRLTVRLRVFPH